MRQFFSDLFRAMLTVLIVWIITLIFFPYQLTVQSVVTLMHGCFMMACMIIVFDIWRM